MMATSKVASAAAVAAAAQLQLLKRHGAAAAAAAAQLQVPAKSGGIRMDLLRIAAENAAIPGGAGTAQLPVSARNGGIRMDLLRFVAENAVIPGGAGVVQPPVSARNGDTRMDLVRAVAENVAIPATAGTKRKVVGGVDGRGQGKYTKIATAPGREQEFSAFGMFPTANETARTTPTAGSGGGAFMTAAMRLDGLKNASPHVVAEWQAEIQAEEQKEFAEQQEKKRKETGQLHEAASVLGQLREEKPKRVAALWAKIFPLRRVKGPTAAAPAPMPVEAKEAVRCGSGSPRSANGWMVAEERRRTAAGDGFRGMAYSKRVAREREVFEAVREKLRRELRECREVLEGPGAAAAEKLAADMGAAGATEAEFLEAQEALAVRVQQWQREAFVEAYGGGARKGSSAGNGHL